MGVMCFQVLLSVLVLKEVTALLDYAQESSTNQEYVMGLEKNAVCQVKVLSGFLCDTFVVVLFLNKTAHILDL